MDRKTYLARHYYYSEKKLKVTKLVGRAQSRNVWQQKVEYEKQHMSDTPCFSHN